MTIKRGGVVQDQWCKCLGQLWRRDETQIQQGHEPDNIQRLLKLYELTGSMPVRFSGLGTHVAR